MSSSLLSSPEELLRIRLAKAELERRGVKRREAVKAADHPQRCFLSFLYRCVWTVDEARAGQVRLWPRGLGQDGKSWDDYWFDWDHVLHTRSRAFYDKTRRTMASNILNCWDLWLCAGGQDPRWSELMYSSRNRSCLIQSKKLEGETGSAAFVAKIKALCQNFEENGGREHWKDFPEWEFTEHRGRFSNGSRLEAVAQGGDQVRGPGSTHIRVEEAGFMEQAQNSIETAIPALAGGGHISVVTTPNAMATYLKRLREGKLRVRE